MEAREATLDPVERVDIDALLDRYMDEARSEAEADLARADVERTRLRAAFEAGAPLVALAPLELYDPIDERTLRVPTGTVMLVAEHEGDILIGRLADNTHSLGVVYEEEHRWYPRKYFLPLATLVDRLRVRTDDPAARANIGRLPVKGMERKGVDAHTAVAVRRIEDLADRDELATLPRGVLILLRRGATARDPATGAEVRLPPETRAEVTEPVGNFRDPDDPVAPEIPVVVDGRALLLPFDVLMHLDLKKDVLTLRAQERLREAEMARRLALRRLLGVGIGAAFLAGNAGWYLGSSRREEDEPGLRRHVLSALVPELAFLFAYFGAGGKYWFDLRGALMDLKSARCLDVVRELTQILDGVSDLSRSLAGTYERTYHRTVHVSWNETRHYRTDKDGKQHYSHSTWSKGYARLWCEPRGLHGWHGTVQRWAGGDGHRAARSRRLLENRIFNLLDADAEHAERSFTLSRQLVGFGRDASLSALSAAICTLPAAFYDDLLGFMTGNGSAEAGPTPPAAGYFPHQKHALLAAGAVAGVVLAVRHQRRHDAQMRQNKYDLGEALEAQIRRVPTLPVEAAFLEHFGSPGIDRLADELGARGPESGSVAGNAVDFTHTHGTGWDNGRPLDSLRIDSAPVRQAFAAAVPRWPEHARRLGTFLGTPDHRQRLLPVLRNAVGTDLLEAQIREDRSEAAGGSLRRSLWFSLPVWGAAVLDGVLKALR